MLATLSLDFNTLPRHHWALRYLPPLPASATRLLRLLNDPNAGFREFSEVIAHDPSFAWEVLRAANSPLFSLPYAVEDLFQAVAIVGVERVKALIFIVAMSAEFRHAFREESLKACWMHSLATAYLSAEIAGGLAVDAGAAYTAGLLHDLGRLALMTSYPAKYSEMIRESFREEREMCELEQEFFEIDHRVAGATMCILWGLPESLAAICLCHHDGLPENPRGLLATVTLANRLAHHLGFQPVFERDMGFDDIAPFLPAELLERGTALRGAINDYFRDV